MIVAIDGPAGSGKSSTAKEVAKRLEFVHLDTGAMYRAVTLAALEKNIQPTDDTTLAELVTNLSIEFDGLVPNAKTLLDGKDVSSKIRGDSVTNAVSDYCKPAVVRDKMVELQRSMAHGRDVVCEGRDIGTVVFPNAEIKIFMVASVEARAARRKLDFKKLGIEKDIGVLIDEIKERDRKDSERENSPLLKAYDAVELDTTKLTFDEQVEFIVQKVLNTELSDNINL